MIYIKLAADKRGASHFFVNHGREGPGLKPDSSLKRNHQYSMGCAERSDRQRDVSPFCAARLAIVTVAPAEIASAYAVPTGVGRILLSTRLIAGTVPFQG